MKILHIHPSFSLGGIESMIVNLANSMCSDNDVTVASIYSINSSHENWNKLDDRINKITLKKNGQGFSWQMIKVVWNIYRLIKNGKFDVVNLHGFFYFYIIAVVLLHRKVTFFYTVHSDARMENATFDKHIYKFKRFCFKHGWVHPITISENSNQSFKDYYGTGGKLIPNGINLNPIDENIPSSLDAYRKGSNTKLLINVGRIDIPKNQVVLCKCIKTMIDKSADIVLLIAGPVTQPSIMESMKKYIDGMRIVYLGEISNARSYFYGCDAMILPSIYEGLPVTLLEAMSVGCIPLCTPVGGIPNVIEDEADGLLSNGTEEEDILTLIDRYLKKDKEELASMGKNAKSKIINEYTINKTTKEYIQYYKQMINEEKLN